MIRNYQPTQHTSDGGYRVIDLPFFALPIILTGIALGWLASFLGQWFYLIFVFPLAIAVGIFGAASLFTRLAKMRNTRIAGGVGLLAGLAAMTTMHYFNYRHNLGDFQAALVKQGIPAGVAATIPKPSFWEHQQQLATEGVEIGSRGSATNLGYWGSWIYWLIEAGVVMLGAMGGTVVAASQPFCVECNLWKKERRLGSFDVADPAPVKERIEAGRLDELPAMVGKPGSRLHLNAYVCPVCEHEATVVVQLMHETLDEKGKSSFNYITGREYPAGALTDLQAVFAEPPPLLATANVK